MFVAPIQTYILIYKKIYEHWGVAGTLVYVTFLQFLNDDVTMTSLFVLTNYLIYSAVLCVPSSSSVNIDYDMNRIRFTLDFMYE